MIAVDTNVVVRLVARDHAAQHAAAHRLFAAGRVHIPIGVLIEVEWVLRSLGWDRVRIGYALVQLLSLHNVSVPAMREVGWALERHAQGADLADMLHIAAARDADRFVTFDRRAIRDAGEQPPIPIELLANSNA